MFQKEVGEKSGENDIVTRKKKMLESSHRAFGAHCNPIAWKPKNGLRADAGGESEFLAQRAAEPACFHHSACYADSINSFAPELKGSIGEGPNQMNY